MKNTSIGIISFYVKLKLTCNGNIASINWPLSGYNKVFYSKDELFIFTINYAKKNDIYNDDFIVDLNYNKKYQKACWVFQFPTRVESNHKEYNTIEVDWKELKIIDDYKTLIHTIY